ncbi:MAG: CoA pyrophosphatase [Thermoproteota archaeon]|jgi:8-oxo-dGTP pyrophosphatase MutT (NUDIX family)|nr:CoA pyrophosphatase [Thermoproteota archaeon]
MQEVFAAVAIIVRRNNEVLFVKRKKREGDPWSGDVALPGGMHKKEDLELINTAIREVKEEVGIDLSKHEYIGSLPFLSSIVRKELKVKAFIFALKNEEFPVKNEEIDDFYWISLKKLKRKFVYIEKIKKRRIAYVYENITIWGLTYRILTLLKKLYPQFF